MIDQTVKVSPNLAEKIAKARVKLGSLKPDKTNKDQGYNYISADKILERGGDVLAEFGVTIIPSVTETILTSVDRPNKSPRIDAMIKLQFQVTDGITGYLADWVGCGSDYVTPDKAIYKAITSGHKYFLMKLLNVGIGNEDSEHESDEPKERPAKQEPAPAQPVNFEVTPEMMAAETSSTGEKYMDMDTPTLANRINGMSDPKNKSKLTPEERERKTAVIQAILAARQEAQQ